MKLLRFIFALVLCFTGVAVQAKIVHLSRSQGIIAEVQKYEFVIVKYSARWCGPCKALAPIIQKLEREFPNITIIEIDVDEYGASVRSVPTLEFYVKGKKVFETVGNPGESGMRNYIKTYFKPVCATPAKK